MRQIILFAMTVAALWLPDRVAAQAVTCAAAGLTCPAGYVCLQGQRCGRAAPAAEETCDRPGYRKMARGCWPASYQDCGNGYTCDPGTQCNKSGSIEAGCSFYYGVSCRGARDGKCPQGQVCNPQAGPNDKACYDPATNYVCPDRKLICTKGRECLEQPTLATSCIFIDGPAIPQQARAASEPRGVATPPARVEQPARTDPRRTDPPARPSAGKGRGMLDD